MPIVESYYGKKKGCALLLVTCCFYPHFRKEIAHRCVYSKDGKTKKKKK